MAKFDDGLINNLVMDTKRLKTLKALAKNFARLNKNEELMTEGPWSADFVKGKGHGLIFLLHGKPGVGKTCTAGKLSLLIPRSWRYALFIHTDISCVPSLTECIAEYTQRPLMVLTSSDISTNPATVEINLTREFKKAKSWGAVLLIDEADVFMQQRDTRDLERNSLVAGKFRYASEKDTESNTPLTGFLRALEFFDGILFLTTNRVGTFDDAFMSRVHVKLYYPEFDDRQRAQIWQTFVDKLARERSKDMRLHPDAKYYLKGKEIKAMKWNGRDIRNGSNCSTNPSHPSSCVSLDN